jgi:hypothetical protein
MSDFDKTMSSSSAAGASSSSSSASSAGAKPAAEFNYRLPSEVTLKHAVKLSIVEDKPIMLDYWTASLDKKALIGAKESGEKLLVKSEDEYTSGISKICKSGAEFIIITENSIYIVSADIPPRKIS